MSATLSNRVYEALRDEITRGALLPGQRLVRRTVARQLGVSPLPVIEALARLERDGLVVSRQHGGAEVPQVTTGAVREEALLREALECQIARLAAVEASQRDFDDLAVKARQLDELMERHDPTSRIGRQLHMEFHLRLAHLAGSKLLEQQVGAVWLRHLMHINWINAGLLPPPERWHQQLVEVVRRGDPDAAEVKMREHVRFGFENLAAAVQQLRDNAPERGAPGADKR